MAVRTSEPARPDVWVPPAPSPAELLAGSAAGVAGRVWAPIGRPIVRQALTRLFRDPDDDGGPTGPATGDGWFGPDDVIWRVHADTSMFVAGIAALALQALHPLAMAGVAEHSDFAVDPLARLRRTAGFVGVTAYGTSADAEAACAAVRAIHERVRGRAPDGRDYSAGDPELLDWIHCAEFAAFASAHRRYGARPTTRSELDRYVDEVARIAVELGDPDPPRSWAQLHDHLEHHRRSAVVGEQARAAWRFLEDPPLAAPVRAAWPILFRGAMACLPPWATDLWGVDRPTTADRAACRAIVRSLGSLLGRPQGLDDAERRVSGPGALT